MAQEPDLNGSLADMFCAYVTAILLVSILIYAATIDAEERRIKKERADRARRQEMLEHLSVEFQYAPSGY